MQTNTWNALAVPHVCGIPGPLVQLLSHINPKFVVTGTFPACRALYSFFHLPIGAPGYFRAGAIVVFYGVESAVSGRCAITYDRGTR